MLSLFCSPFRETSNIEDGSKFCAGKTKKQCDIFFGYIMRFGGFPAVF